MQKREAKQFGFDHHDHVIDSFPKKKGPPWQSKCKRDHPFGKKEGKILSRCYFWHRAASSTMCRVVEFFFYLKKLPLGALCCTVLFSAILIF
jgi:hypothetical protein